MKKIVDNFLGAGFLSERPLSLISIAQITDYEKLRYELYQTEEDSIKETVCLHKIEEVLFTVNDCYWLINRWVDHCNRRQNLSKAIEERFKEVVYAMDYTDLRKLMNRVYGQMSSPFHSIVERRYRQLVSMVDPADVPAWCLKQLRLKSKNIPPKKYLLSFISLAQRIDALGQ
ncbi:hypothetical protein KKA50_01310 [Patescibacteria group bacterium]|nr:hypothetical protein [Patescibacteria group bacterium]